MIKYSQLLINNPLFENVPEEMLMTVIDCLNGTYKIFRERTLLFDAEQPIPCLGIVLTGCVEIFLSNRDGNGMLISQSYPGDLFGHALTVAQTSDNMFEIYAMEDTQILFLTVPEFTALKNSGCTHRFKVMENLMKLIAKNNMELIMKIQILTQTSLRQKLLLYFSILSKEQHSSCIILPFGREKLAFYLYCDRSALSRELSRMKKEGIIELSGNTVTLLQ